MRHRIYGSLLAVLFAVVGQTTGWCEEPGFRSLFNGKDLSGWEGDLKLWKVVDGTIVGDSSGIEHNQFLVTKDEFGNFELKLEFRLKDGIGNSGVQFRTKRIPNSTEVSGYQADIGENYWGCLYDESRRNKILAAPKKEELDKVLKRDDWNKYRILCEGRHIQLWINDFKTVDYTEADEAIEQKGLIALQIHGGPPGEAHYRNIRIRRIGQ